MSATIISAARGERLSQFLTDLWNYRELFLTFVERDLRVRYKQTALGVIWVVLQPLVMTGAFAIIFGRIGRMPTEEMHPLLFYFAALAPWTAFARAVTGAALSIESSANLVAKVYFPRLIVPAAVVLATFFDFLIGMTLLNLIAVFLGNWTASLLAITPLLMTIQACTALGIGVVLAAINAQYRDVKHAVHFIVQLLLLATPIIYPLSRLPQWAQQLAFINPMAAVVTTYRACLQPDAVFHWQLLGFSFITAFIYLWVGVWFFRKREKRLADVL
jgi:lipopolysaccharide transport system permease protein